jgi:hypothetical protein
VFSFQAIGLIASGPSNYYGNAHQDQVNYVQLSQFLVEKPFSSGLPGVGLHPWLVKGIDLKVERIGQSVANGFLAVVTGTDSEATYGTTSIFFIALLSLVLFELLSALGAGRWIAGLGACWVCVLPAVTKAHLDGFLSQTSVLFIAPILLLALRAAPRNFRLAWVVSAVFLAFLLTAYTEVYIVGVAFAGLACLLGLRLRFRLRALLLTLAIGGSLVLAAPFAARYAPPFAVRQYRVAANPDTPALSVLVPDSGTWRGWAEFFFPAGADALNPSRLAVLASFLLLPLLLTGLLSRNLARRLGLAAALTAPAGILILLLSEPVFHKYAFSKIIVTFIPVAGALIVLGVARLQLLPGFAAAGDPSDGPTPVPVLPRPPVRAAAASVLGLLVLSAAAASYPMQLGIVANSGILSAVNSAGARAAYAELERHPERVYVIKEQHPIVNAWLAYHGRRSEVYVDANMLGDRPVPSDQFAFRRLPGTLGECWLVTRERVESYANPEASPDLIIRNSQGVERDGVLTWAWIADKLQFEIVHFGGRAPALYRLGFRAIAGPANPSPARSVTFVDDRTGASQRAGFSGESVLGFTVALHRGSNFFTLRIDEPTAWLAHLPADPRKLMMRIQEINLVPVGNSSDTRP